MERDCIRYTGPGDFLADGWLGPRHSSGGDWPMREVLEAHANDERVILADSVWGFINRDGVRFTVWLFGVDGIVDGVPSIAAPIAEVIGTTFDGVRELHGAPCFMVRLPELARALTALDATLESRGWSLP